MSSKQTREERRRSRRREAYGTFVAIEAPAVSEDACWSGTLMDINGDGMALSMPGELKPGIEVFLTLGLGQHAHLERVPAVIVRVEDGVGAVEFKKWPEEERLKLLSFLLED